MTRSMDMRRGRIGTGTAKEKPVWAPKSTGAGAPRRTGTSSWVLGAFVFHPTCFQSIQTPQRSLRASPGLQRGQPTDDGWSPEAAMALSRLVTYLLLSPTASSLDLISAPCPRKAPPGSKHSPREREELLSGLGTEAGCLARMGHHHEPIQ